MKKKSGIKISSISKTSGQFCGIPSECFEKSTLVINIEEPDIELIQLVKCLNRMGVDENIRGVQFDIGKNITRE